MNNAIVVHLATQLLWIVLLLSMPVVLVASVVGLIVSLLQALTQIQDQTLQFLIKLLAVSATLLITYHWMGVTLLNYTQQTFSQVGNMRP
ncbi:EscS/YscS/HrcS family type III secretion system export apparatus protein [Yersinia massiliensis]|jgi:type III secretion protein S|uniref:EscS/YscS/HrcS family type III secretion system export apparatus protein n=3 Tax=Yersinia TaxID=629 RepID=A0A0T9P2A7_9GAMM|nr:MULTISPECIES: EscS/YscS/HrcS family type III secretion system export apparatus protein [Yersinia]HEC1649109.1 EscS/YscS/HrcS family type III secretion system export apparatus protein [Yersinia enterocolitica]ATM88307.1 EscS/YscS/HrcS family type III secretion system export apparatus protein [Yersinia frederiksenii]AVX39924.1 EscS/YscS/HrcS family type III secretion system export apparatus protein [Yersinia massiliensis]MCB5307091.1 EscS/YscS/HrcS family type III secretion system export appar